ncbi:hydroxylysine kinase-like isoform X2 [Styela clava]
MQHAMSKHLHLHGINASIPMETTDGKTVVDYTFDGKRYSVQLLSFVDGVSINEAEMSKDEVIEIAFHMGQLCGRFHQVMKTFHYDVERASHHNPFHTEKAAMFDEKKLAYVKDSSMKNQLRRYMNLFKEHFLPRLSELRKGFIHGDISDTNIILQEGSKDGGKKHWEICGLIDMEDCGYCCIVGELGVSTAYAMLRAVSVEADPVEASRQTIQGYQSIQSLTAEEKEILFYVIANRLVVSYISASYESFLKPGNSLYLFTQAKNVPAVLNVFPDSTTTLGQRYNPPATVVRGFTTIYHGKAMIGLQRNTPLCEEMRARFEYST